MKWINHTLIAGSICAVISPIHVAPVVIGATAPDWMEWLVKLTGRHIKHRGPTHILTHWLIAALASRFRLTATGVFIYSVAAFAPVIPSSMPSVLW